MNYSRIIFEIRNRGPSLQVLWTGSSGDAIRAHHEPTVSGGQRLTGAEASQRCEDRGLAMIGGKDRGDSGGPYHRLHRFGNSKRNLNLFENQAFRF
jgi:hypothetical protein